MVVAVDWKREWILWCVYFIRQCLTLQRNEIFSTTFIYLSTWKKKKWREFPFCKTMHAAHTHTIIHSLWFAKEFKDHSIMFSVVWYEKAQRLWMIWCQNQKCVYKTQRHTKHIQTAIFWRKKQPTIENSFAQKQNSKPSSAKSFWSTIYYLFEQLSSKSHICTELCHHWTLKIRNSIHYYEQEIFPFFILRVQRLPAFYAAGQVLLYM